MKSNKLSIAITAGVMFAALGTSAFAGDRTYTDGDTSWQFHNASNTTRAQVADELRESRAPVRLVQDGSSEYAYPQAAGIIESRSRAEVRAEATAMIRAANDVAADLYFGA